MIEMPSPHGGQQIPLGACQRRALPADQCRSGEVGQGKFDRG